MARAVCTDEAETPVCVVFVSSITGTRVIDLEVPCGTLWGLLVAPVAAVLGIKRRAVRLINNSSIEPAVAQLDEKIAPNGGKCVHSHVVICEPSCSNCGLKSDYLKVCSRCRLVAYCSTHCQVYHYGRHKKTCKAIRRASAQRRLLPDPVGEKERVQDSFGVENYCNLMYPSVPGSFSTPL